MCHRREVIWTYRMWEILYQKAHLIQHQRTHSGEKPSEHEKCGKSFCSNSHPIHYSRTRMGVNLYKCNDFKNIILMKPYDKWPLETGFFHQHNALEIYPSCCIYWQFILFISECSNLFNHSPTEGHLGGFQYGFQFSYRFFSCEHKSWFVWN